MEKYTYLRTDFPISQYNTTALQNEIHADVLLNPKYMHIDTFSNEVYINFTEVLSTQEKANLDNIVANHDMDFGINPDPVVIDLPPIDTGEDISFETPASDPLPSINTSFNNINVLGSGGPNLSNITAWAINWDLVNTSIYSHNLSTSDGIPSWWLNLLTKGTTLFNKVNPEITFADTGIAGLDGDYWVNKVEDDFVFVSKSGGFTIHLSNQESDYIPTNADGKFLGIKDNGEIISSGIKINHYGSYHKFAKLDEEQSTTSSAWQNVLSLTTGDLPLGNYKILVSHRYGISVTNNYFYSRVNLNSNQLGNEFVVRENNSVNRRHNEFNFIVTLSGINTIDLQYRRGAGTAYISNMIIEILRVN